MNVISVHYTPAIEECQQYCWEHCNASNSSDEKWRSRQNFQMNKRDNKWVFFSLQFFFSLDSNSEIFTCNCNLRMKFDTSIIKLTFISHSDETLYLLKSDMLLWNACVRFFHETMKQFSIRLLLLDSQVALTPFDTIYSKHKPRWYTATFAPKQRIRYHKDRQNWSNVCMLYWMHVWMCECVNACRLVFMYLFCSRSITARVNTWKRPRTHIVDICVCVLSRFTLEQRHSFVFGQWKRKHLFSVYLS